MTKKEKWVIAKWEINKLKEMWVFYVLLIMCLNLNVFLLYDGLRYKYDNIQSDIQYLLDDREGFSLTYAYDSYVKLDMLEVYDHARYKTSYDDWTKQRMVRNYQKLQERADVMEEAEKNSISFTGNSNLHAVLFETYMRAILVEMILFMGIVTIYSMHFEIYQQTDEMMNTYKVGEEFYNIKLLVSAGFGLLFALLLAVLSLGLYFTVVDYSSIWDSYISSNYNLARRTLNDLYLFVYPYVTWIPMTIRQYLYICFSVVTTLSIIVNILIGGLSKIIKNSVALLVTIGCGAAAMYLFGNVIHFSNVLEYLCKCNPVHLITKCGYWFMDYAPGDTYPFYEITTLFVWALIGIVIIRGCFTGRYEV